jgi:predicted transcriptional regulator
MKIFRISSLKQDNDPKPEDLEKLQQKLRSVQKGMTELDRELTDVAMRVAMIQIRIKTHLDDLGD